MSVSNAKYRGSILLELDTLVVNNPQLTMGEIFDSFLRPVFLGGNNMREATDEQIFTALEKAKEREGEDSPMTEEETKSFLNG